METTRLVMRRWTVDDAADLTRAVGESLEHLQPFMPWAAHEPVSDEERLRWIRSWDDAWRKGTDSALGIFADNEVVGALGLHRRVGPGGVEIGYWIHADHLRQGYATEAVGAATQACFRLPDVERVEIHHDKANVASAGVPAKLGFTLVEEAPGQISAPGQIGIEYRWIMTRTDWRLGPTWP